MRKIKILTAVIALALSLSAPQAFAGDIPNPPGVTGDILAPGINGQMDTPRKDEILTPGAAGDISMPGVAGDMAGPGAAGDILMPGLNGWIGTGFYGGIASFFL